MEELQIEQRYYSSLFAVFCDPEVTDLLAVKQQIAAFVDMVAIIRRIAAE